MLWPVYILFTGLFTTVASYTTAMAGVTASLTIHYKLLQTVLRCPLAVFAQNPAGRFLNRFSSDMSTVDLVMPFTYRSVVNSILGLLITVAVVGATLPGALVAMAVLALPYALIQVCVLLDSTFAMLIALRWRQFRSLIAQQTLHYRFLPQLI